MTKPLPLSSVCDVEECVICFYPLKGSSIGVVECGHKFHYMCIKKWLRLGKEKRCPLCTVGRKLTKVRSDKPQSPPKMFCGCCPLSWLF